MTRNETHIEQPADDERFFEAVRYLLDEMTIAEAEQFEADLATDQSLREQLAEAVLLTEATYQAHVPHTVSKEPVEVASKLDTVPGNRFSWTMLASLAAMLVIALTVGTTFYLNDGVQRQIAQPNTNSEEIQLAVAWVQHIEEETEEMDVLWDELPEDEDESLDQLLAGSPENPPSWMLKALAAQQEEDANNPAL